MKMRWVARVLFLGMTLLLVAGWVGSYWRGVLVGWSTYGFALGNGNIVMGIDWPPPDFIKPTFQFDWILPKFVGSQFDNYGHSFAGFRWAFDYISGYAKCQIRAGCPFWFVTCVSGLITWFIWRRKGKQRVVGRFEVEAGMADELEEGK
jgi:hypothetical protein